MSGCTIRELAKMLKSGESYEKVGKLSGCSSYVELQEMERNVYGYVHNIPRYTPRELSLMVNKGVPEYIVLALAGNIRSDELRAMCAFVNGAN